MLQTLKMREVWVASGIMMIFIMFISVLIGFLAQPFVGASRVVLISFAFLFLSLMFLLSSLQKIPAEPPSKGTFTLLGERRKGAINEGWQIFPPFLTGVIITDVRKVNEEILVEVTTPDLARLSILIGLTWTPDRESSGGLLVFQDSGGNPGVSDILMDITMEKIREWAISDPDTWEDALKAQIEVTAILIEEIAGLQDMDHATRVDLIKEISGGNGAQKLAHLGIILNRLNVVEIKPLGGLLKAAEQAAVEERQRVAEVIEIDHVKERIVSLIQGDGALSPTEALEVIQTERGKIKKSVAVEERRVSLSQGTVDVLVAALKALKK